MEARNIGVQKSINKNIKTYLAVNGIVAAPMYIKNGSMHGCVRIYQRMKTAVDGCDYSLWTQELVQKLSKLGFTDFDSKPLNMYSGNGGRFSIFARLAPLVMNQLVY